MRFVKTYRNEIADNSPIGKHLLQIIYNTIQHFFHFNKNSDLTEEYFKLVEHIFRNYDTFKEDFLVPRQTFLSADVVYALAGKILGVENEINKHLDYPTFVPSEIQCTRLGSIFKNWTKHWCLLFQKIVT